MKKFLLSLFTILAPVFLFAQEAQQKSIDEVINEKFGNATGWFVELIFAQIPVTDEVGIPWVVIMLLGFATFFTIYFKFINISGFSTALNVVRGKYDDLDHPEAGVLKGDLTPGADIRSEEHTSELQSLAYLVCRLLLEKKKSTKQGTHNT